MLLLISGVSSGDLCAVADKARFGALGTGWQTLVQAAWGCAIKRFMKRSAFLLCAPLLLVACSAPSTPPAPANIAGNWDMRLTFNPQDSVAFSLNLTQASGAVSGRVLVGGRDAEGNVFAAAGAPITGQVDGPSVTLNMPLRRNGSEVDYTFDGSVIGGVIKGVWKSSLSVRGNFLAVPAN